MIFLAETINKLQPFNLVIFSDYKRKSQWLYQEYGRYELLEASRETLSTLLTEINLKSVWRRIKQFKNNEKEKPQKLLVRIDIVPNAKNNPLKIKF